jgi:hypothetical protein
MSDVIREASEADIPALGALFHEVFGQHRPDEIWRWKYFDRDRHASTVFVAGDRIVAHCGGVVVTVADGPRRYPAMQSTDFMSSPSFPGGMGAGGVFIRTVREFFRRHSTSNGIGMLYGFPGERHRLLGERLLGYRAVEPVGEFVAEGARRCDPQPLDDRVLRLITKERTDFGAVRDWPYLHWRYQMHPIHSYEAVIAEGLFGPRAAAIVRRNAAGELLVFELAGSRSMRHAKHLADRLRSMASRVRVWGSLSSPLAKTLVALGFTPCARDHAFETKFFNQRAHPAPGEFHYTLGDYDVD